MKRFLILVVVLMASALNAQNFTTITASNIQDATGQKLASGVLCAIGTDNNDTPLPYYKSATGVVVRKPVCTTITTGAISGYQLANTSTTNPLHVCYRLTVRDSSLPSSAPPLSTLKCVQPTGATYSLDSDFNPNLAPQIPVQSGPRGEQGPPGAAVPNGVLVIDPSGDTTGATDTANIAAAIAASKSIMLSAGDFHVSSGFVVSIPLKIQGVAPGATRIWNHSSTADVFTVNYSIPGGSTNRSAKGAVLRDIEISQAAGVTPTSGCALKVGAGSGNYVIGFHAENINILGTYKGVCTGDGIISDWFQNLYIYNPVSGIGIDYNSQIPAGDLHFDNIEMDGASLVITKADTTQFTNLKVNNGGGIKFQAAATNDIYRVRFINPSVENTSPWGIDFGANGGNQIQIVGGAIATGITNDSNVVGLQIIGVNIANQATATLRGILLPQDYDCTSASGYLSKVGKNGIVTCNGALANAPAPTFSPIAGNYVGTQNVSISCSLGTAYYTLNGTTVSQYSTTIAVPSSEDITAGCYATGYMPSKTVAHYTIGGTVVSDNFDGSSLSSNWTIVTGTFTVASNTVALETGHPAAFYNAIPIPADQFVQAKVAATFFSGGEGGLAVRLQNSGYNGYIADCTPTGCAFFKVVSGSYNRIGADYSGAIALNDVLRFEANGTTLTLKVNGTTVKTETDSTYATGQPGIEFYNGAGYLKLGTWSAGSLY